MVYELIRYASRLAPCPPFTVPSEEWVLVIEFKDAPIRSLCVTRQGVTVDQQPRGDATTPAVIRSMAWPSAYGSLRFCTDLIRDARQVTIRARDLGTGPVVIGGDLREALAEAAETLVLKDPDSGWAPFPDYEPTLDLGQSTVTLDWVGEAHCGLDVPGVIGRLNFEDEAGLV
ncbi:MAG: hypothetical protein K6U08_06240 [Firmicutes bacterium]|nr:hypothetical protein [Bacillota bacterium]